MVTAAWMFQVELENISSLREEPKTALKALQYSQIPWICQPFKLACQVSSGQKLV